MCDPAAEWDRYDVHDFIEQRSDVHKAAHADSYLETSALEWPIQFTSLSYVPAHLLALSGTSQHPVRLAGRTLEIRIPQIDALFVMKLKAYRNRAFKPHYLEAPRLRLQLFPDALEQIASIPPAFMRRKAAKDLADLIFLAAQGADLRRAVDWAGRLQIAGQIAQDWSKLPGSIVDDAEDIVRKHGMNEEPRRTAERLETALAASTRRLSPPRETPVARG